MRISTAKTFAAAACSLALLGVVGCSSDNGSDDSSGTVNQDAATSPSDSPLGGRIRSHGFAGPRLYTERACEMVKNPSCA